MHQLLRSTNTLISQFNSLTNIIQKHDKLLYPKIKKQFKTQPPHQTLINNVTNIINSLKLFLDKTHQFDQHYEKKLDKSKDYKNYTIIAPKNKKKN